jgi:hypothetical protein
VGQNLHRVVWREEQPDFKGHSEGEELELIGSLTVEGRERKKYEIRSKFSVTQLAGLILLTVIRIMQSRRYLEKFSNEKFTL